MEHFLEYIKSGPLDQDKLHLLVHVVEYLCLTHNQFVEEKEQEEEMTSKRGGVLVGLLEVIGQEGVARSLGQSMSLWTRTLLSCLTLLRGILSGTLDMLNPDAQDVAPAQTVKVQLANNTELELMDIDRDLAWKTMSFTGSVEADTSAALNTVIQVMHTLLDDEHMVDQKELEEDFLQHTTKDLCLDHPSFLFHHIPGDLLPPLRRRCLLNSYQSVQESLQSNTDDIIIGTIGQENILTLQLVVQKLSSLTRVVESYVSAQKAEKRKPEKLFEKALYVIQERLRDHEGTFINNSILLILLLICLPWNCSEGAHFTSI